MGRKTSLRPRREFVRAPVHEAERRAVAVHDPLWATGGAGGIEDIGKRLLAGRGRAVADRPQQHQLLAELLRNSEGGATRKGLPAVDSTKRRSEEHTSELQSLMRISYAVFCLKKKKNKRILPRHATAQYSTNAP